MANGKDFAQEAADRLNEYRARRELSKFYRPDEYGRCSELTAYADLLAELSAIKGDMGEINDHLSALPPGLVPDMIAGRIGQAHAIAAKYVVKPDPLEEVLGLILSRRGLPPIKAIVEDEAAFVRAELAKRGINIPSVQGGE